MHRFWPIVLLFLMVTPLNAEQFQIIKVRDTQIDLIHPKTGQIIRSVEGKSIPTPILIQKRLGNGTYLILLAGEKVSIDVGAVDTDEKHDTKSNPDCNNSIENNYVAAHRGLGKGCLK